MADKDSGLPGVTSGYTTVKLISTGEYVTISVIDFRKNKNLYAGPCTGKKNVRSIHKPGYYQISREKDYHEIGASKLHWVHNPNTKEVKQITKNEYVNDEWKIGKMK